MSRHLKFKNLLFNPGLSLDLEEESENCAGRIVDALQGAEGVAGSEVKGISALRARNVQHLAQSDLNYEDEKVQRAELQDANAKEEGYDPSLAKYFLMEGSSDEEEPVSNDRVVKGRNSKSKTLKTKSKTSGKSTVSKTKTVSSDNSENSEGDDDGSEENENASEEEDKLGSDNEEASPGFSFSAHGDYSQYADDFDEEDNESRDESEEEHSQMTVEDFDCTDSEDSEAMVQAARQKLRKKKLLKIKQSRTSKEDADSDEYSDVDESEDDSENDDSGVVDEEEEETDITAVRAKNMSEEQKKAEAVTKQFDLYDKLFESRILLQKVVSSSHQLPQPDVYPAFRRLAGFEGQRYQKSLRAALEAAQSLVDSMLQLQETLLRATPDTETVLTDGSVCASRPAPCDDDEEITSSEDEEEDKDGPDKEAEAQPKTAPEPPGSGSKRKRTDREVLEETEQTLAKRHCNIKAYRNRVVAYWEERTKLLQTHDSSSGRKGGSFAAFEESFSVMVARLLNDRDKVLRRTQLRSANRGNFATPIGGVEHKPKVEVDPELDIPKVEESGVLFQRYDPEIYDDTDFYSFALEQVIKTKMMRGTSSLTTAQFLDFTDKLRKKNKKIVDTKRSKGRKLKYDVHSALLQFLAPRGAPQMEDDAIDVVVHSLFGGQKLTTPA